MKSRFACALLLLTLTGCDRQQYEYVVRYQEYAHASLDQGGGRLFLTARATFVDVQPKPADPAGPERGQREMTADDRYRYVVAHPEIFGPVASRQEYEEQFGEGGGAASADVSTIEIVMSGDHEAALPVAPQNAALTRAGRKWTALGTNPARPAVGGRAGAPAVLHFALLPEVAPARELLTAWQIQRRPTPAADPLELTLTLDHEGRAQTVVFRFDRVAEHPPLPPNPLYRLYAAH